MTMAMVILDPGAWPSLFGLLGIMFSILVYLAPLPTFIRIYKEKSTMLYHCFPYVVTQLSSELWLYHHVFLQTDMPQIIISFQLLGFLIENIYIIIFLSYADRKLQNDTTNLVVFKIVVSWMIVILTYYPLKGDSRVSVVGWIRDVVYVCVVASPLSVAFQVIRTRSAEFLPFPLSCCLTLNAFMWFCYGLLIRDLCIALPNGLGFFFGMLQMLLYGMYRNRKEPLGTSEVHHVGDLEKNGNGDDYEVARVKEGNQKKTSEEEK